METTASHSPLLAFGVFVAGLAALLASASYFVDGMAKLAAALGVPPLVIGMTLVAFGTSTPELVVNGLSAVRGETGLAFGNVVGACTLNLGLVLAITAMVRPLRVEPSLITREIPMLSVSVVALLILGSDQFLDQGTANGFGRADGLILLLLFGIFLYYTVIYSIASDAICGLGRDAFLDHAVEEMRPARTTDGMARDSAKTLLALVCVSLSADWTVTGAAGIARFAGLSENIIGLTIVSTGTTLPEMLTCILAARRGNADIALGNVVGSNIFNILAIGGMVSVIRPLPVPEGGTLDLLFMAFLTLLLLPIAIRRDLTVTRGEGLVLFLANAGYMSYRLLAAR